MRKAFYSLTFFLLVATVILPWVDGYLFKQRYLTLLQTIARENKIAIKVLNYHQGLHFSTAKISVNLLSSAPNLFAENPELLPSYWTINQRISHGPFLYNGSAKKWQFAQALIESKLHLSPKIEKLLLGNDNHDGFAQVDSLVNFFNEFTNKVTLAPLKFQLPNNVQLQWGGMQGNLYFSLKKNRLHQIKSNWVMGEFSFVHLEDHNSFVIEPVSSYENLRYNPSGLWSGLYTISTRNVTINLRESPLSPLKFSHFELLNTFDIAKNHSYNTNLEITLGKLSTAKFTVSPASFRIIAKNLNTDGIMDVINASYADYKDKEDIFIASDHYFYLLPRIITPQTFINGELTILTSLGNFLANIKISWPLKTALPVTTTEIMEKIDMEATLRVSTNLINVLLNALPDKLTFNHPKSFNTDINLTSTIESADLKKGDLYTQETEIDLSQQFDNLLHAGFIVQNDEDYLILISRQNGVLKVNGKQKSEDDFKKILFFDKST